MLILFILPSCSSGYLKDFAKFENSKFIEPIIFGDNFEKTTYKTNLTVMGNNLSGILLIKKTSEEEFRFVFVSEIGLKYFDLGIKNSNVKQEYTTHYLMPALNRGETKDILFNDFSKLTIQYLSKSKPIIYKQTTTENIAIKYNEPDNESVYFLDDNNSNIERILWKNNITGKSQIILSHYHTSIPQQIEISNKKYGLNMDMKEIIND